MLTSEQIWNTPHYDIDGNRMTLLQLVRKDPEWAASRMAHERAELENLKAGIERLRWALRNQGTILNRMVDLWESSSPPTTRPGWLRSALAALEARDADE